MNDINKLIELFRGCDTVKFILTGCGEEEFKTIEFKSAIEEIEEFKKEKSDIDRVKSFIEEFDGDIVQSKYGDKFVLETAGGKYWGCSFEFTENGDFLGMYSTNDA